MRVFVGQLPGKPLMQRVYLIICVLYPRAARFGKPFSALELPKCGSTREGCTRITSTAQGTNQPHNMGHIEAFMWRAISLSSPPTKQHNRPRLRFVSDSCLPSRITHACGPALLALLLAKGAVSARVSAACVYTCHAARGSCKLQLVDRRVEPGAIKTAPGSRAPLPA